MTTYADILKAVKKNPPKKIKLPKPLNVGEETLAQQLKALGIPFEREFRFSPPRMWKFDFALPSLVAVEIEGAVWTNGRHTRGAGYLADMEKYNTASMIGWTILRYTPDQIKTGQPSLEISQFVRERSSIRSMREFPKS